MDIVTAFSSTPAMFYSSPSIWNVSFVELFSPTCLSSRNYSREEWDVTMVLAEMQRSHQNLRMAHHSYPQLVEPPVCQQQDEKRSQIRDRDENHKMSNIYCETQIKEKMAERIPFQLWTPWKDVFTTNKGQDAVVFSRFVEEIECRLEMSRNNETSLEVNDKEDHKSHDVLTLPAEKDSLKLECQKCGKQFLHIKSLQNHFRRHSAQTTCTHSCSICHKVFLQKSSLTTHLRIHTGERPFECSECSKAFGDYSTYTKHLRIHSGAKPYQCPQCLRGFSQSGNLIRHLKRHQTSPL